LRCLVAEWLYYCAPQIDILNLKSIECPRHQEHTPDPHCSALRVEFDLKSLHTTGAAGTASSVLNGVNSYVSQWFPTSYANG
jgi:hypothetical protein